MAADVVLATLNHAWKSLEPLGYPCALMGGMALSVWNHPRSTRDIDLLIGVSTSEVDALVRIMQSAGFRPKHTPAMRQVGALRLIQLLYTPPEEFYDMQVDLLLADSTLEQSSLSRRIACKLPGVDSPVSVLKCDDLILLKLVSGRLIDRADAAMLLRENRESIDFPYLAVWSEQLDLRHELTESWNEACPGEIPPWNTQ